MNGDCDTVTENVIQGTEEKQKGVTEGLELNVVGNTEKSYITVEEH